MVIQSNYRYCFFHSLTTLPHLTLARLSLKTPPMESERKTAVNPAPLIINTYDQLKYKRII